MNKPDIKKKVYSKLDQKYEDAFSTITECSKDQNEPLVYLDKEVYDFDTVKKIYCQENNMSEITSVDSLDAKEGKIILIEFKNKNKIPYKEIRGKVHDSLEILEREFDVPRNQFNNFEVVVVYSPQKKNKTSLEKMRKHLGKLIGSEKDEIEHFESFKKWFDITSYKFSPEDFRKYIEK